MAEPARSRKMMRALWGSAGNEEEARAYLQARLAVFCKAIFWAFLALVGFLCALYAAYPEKKPHLQDWIYFEATLALALLAFIWRVALLRGDRSLDVLHRIDMFIASGAGCVFGMAAILGRELQASAYTCMIYASFMVFTRALIVPSSGSRTVLVSTAGLVPIALAAVGLAVWYPHDIELPAPPFIVGAVIYCSAATLLAATGSRIIYGLTRERDAAMQLGSYRLERKIGAGGMGEVFRARHILLRRPTAVKRLLPDKIGSAENLERFEREVQLMSQLTHPNTVAVYDYGHSPDGMFYYAMEYLDGINLEDLVHLDGPQKSGRIVQILVQVCGALQEAHDRGLIHRDIKPPNIILCERGGMPDIAKVVDFGLVKEFTADTGTSTQVVLGTPAYIAPEALTDPSNIGPPVDLYSLGCVGYFLLTGKRVFQGKTQVDVVIQHATATPRPPSEVASVHVDPALEAIVMRCLAKKPEERYASATELAAALRAIQPGDWSDADARRWWAEFKARAKQEAEVASAPTLTITVDLGQRDA